jgi:hypothetical protein
LNYKLLFVDIDGTIFDHSNNTIHQSTIYALKKVREAGIKVILCSGRNYAMAQELGVTSLIDIDGGVYLNGAITCYDSKIIHTSVLDEKTINNLVQFANDYKLTAMVNSLNETYLCTPKNEVYETIIDYLRIFNVRNKELDTSVPVQLILTLSYYDERILLEQFKNISVHRWHDYGTDIMQLNNSKATGILALNEYLGVKPEECIAIGDGSNDIEMLKTCGLSIAMGNASNRLKEVADYVTSDVKEDGIYDAIKHFAFELGIKDF